MFVWFENVVFVSVFVVDVYVMRLNLIVSVFDDELLFVGFVVWVVFVDVVCEIVVVGGWFGVMLCELFFYKN